jgi:membrane protease YdiL (CAAX protease family)
VCVDRAGGYTSAVTADRSERAPYQWLWTLAMVAPAAAAGFAFGHDAVALGFAMAALALLVLVALAVWAVRRGRRRRASGAAAADLGRLASRLRARATWLSVLAVLSVVASGFALATRGSDTPAWPLVLGPVLLVVGVVWIWIFILVLLPRMQREQARRRD